MSKEATLNNQNLYRQRVKDEVKIYEHIENKAKVYCLPIIWKRDNNNNNNNNNNNTPVVKRKSECKESEKVEEAEEKKKSKCSRDTNMTRQKKEVVESENLGKESQFEYIENNLNYVKNRLEVIASHVNESDLLIIPINYNDILNEHLLEIGTFNNFVNTLDLLFYQKQEKDNHYNVIFFIYNYDDTCTSENDISNRVEKEKKEIMSLIKNFMKIHWKGKYEKYVKDTFLFEKSSSIDIAKMNNFQNIPVKNKRDHINKEKPCYDLKNSRNKMSNIQYGEEKNPFFSSYKPNILKNMMSENYFLYNFFSNIKIDILQEYLRKSNYIRINILPNDINQVDIKKTINCIRVLINRYNNIKINEKNKIKNNNILINHIKDIQKSYLLHFIYTDLLEKYEWNLEKIKNYLLYVFKENIKKVHANYSPYNRSSSNSRYSRYSRYSPYSHYSHYDIMNELKKQIYFIDTIFEKYNFKLSFINYLFFKNKFKKYFFEKKCNYIYFYYKTQLFQSINEMASDIVNFYISKGFYVRNYDLNSFLLIKKYNLFNYIIDYLTTIFKNKINFSFNYLSPNAFGFSSYKDDISLDPKRDILVTSSEMDQVEKISIPPSPYSKTMLLMNKGKR
ncbi:conserved Plasmodium protein, unknown function [Plasmodium ovale]|uniref:Uncharacterized protein n=1 Tax=Plasmodium ovale TaxID=36330 RepID=A0A1D3THE6_PLAOA|nr:conserved Plasmodium protein, unknown function [Plasmodium ovale]